MAANTGISWADDTFNPWEGCQKVSPACDGCYAEARNLRYAPKGTEAAPNWGPGAPRRRTSASNWAKPLKWEREQAEAYRAWTENGHVPPEPTRFVFCASLADVFDNQVPVEWRQDLFRLIFATPHLTWLLLTKRPGNILDWVQAQLGADATAQTLAHCWPRNAAIGCTVATQEEADRDIPKLLRAKMALHPAFAFVSMEPLLGPVDLDVAWNGETALAAECWGDCLWCAKGHPPLHNCQKGKGDWEAGRSGLDWVITGGETRQGKSSPRPSHPDWFRSLRDQCAAAGVRYHHKQNGEWAPGECSGQPLTRSQKAGWLDGDGWEISRVTPSASAEMSCDDEPDVWLMGKAQAGRTLDGVVHDARPVPLEVEPFRFQT